DETRRRRFLREARAAAAVTHANIAAIHEVGEENNQIYIAMELVEGRSLRRMLGEGMLPIKDAVHIGKQIARGLAKAHDKGIVHRDLKPDNVMVSEDLQVKVLDFGVAKSLVDAASDAREPGAPVHGDAGMMLTDVTHEGQLVGTPAYMSPEQAVGQPVDAR